MDILIFLDSIKIFVFLVLVDTQLFLNSVGTLFRFSRFYGLRVLDDIIFLDLIDNQGFQFKSILYNLTTLIYVGIKVFLDLVDTLVILN